MRISIFFAILLLLSNENIQCLSIVRKPLFQKEG